VMLPLNCALFAYMTVSAKVDSRPYHSNMLRSVAMPAAHCL